MLDMIKKQIIPSVNTYIKELSETAKLKSEIGCGDNKLETELINKLSCKNFTLYEKTLEIEEHLGSLSKLADMKQKAEFFRDTIIPAMKQARKVSDDMEKWVSSKHWPFPTYNELLFNV